MTPESASVSPEPAGGAGERQREGNEVFWPSVFVVVKWHPGNRFLRIESSKIRKYFDMFIIMYKKSLKTRRYEDVDPVLRMTVAAVVTEMTVNAFGRCFELNGGLVATEIYGKSLEIRKVNYFLISDFRKHKRYINEIKYCGFSVAFDPLHESNIVDTNFTVGTIFGVWPRDKLTGVTGGDQVAAAMGIYGPRTTYIIAIKGFP
ncbi:fructose-1,6-bisphosphatase [Artemisia annua]|uniref:Fructose-1,6-bisphosphatase n=1 Tax=Artemisia annua TaxID=35608 RepID=A0A2U1L1T2_ARTAN|nr:fructose-1,6-bisphosphatase [Artemisia annua]